VRTYTNCLSQEETALTGRWSFDENGGSRVHDDTSENHHGSLSSGDAWVAGRTGTGIDLSEAQISIPNDDLTLLPPTGKPFSISFWLRPGLSLSGRRALMRCTEGTNTGWELTLQTASSGNTSLAFESVNTGGTLKLSAPVNLAFDTWAKFDITYNGGIATLYADGRKLASDSGAIRGSRAPLTIGAFAGATNLDAIIDDLRIYGRERDASEIGPVAPVMWETA